jgi:hypothetical protein
MVKPGSSSSSKGHSFGRWRSTVQGYIDGKTGWKDRTGWTGWTSVQYSQQYSEWFHYREEPAATGRPAATALQAQQQ